MMLSSFSLLCVSDEMSAVTATIFASGSNSVDAIGQNNGNITIRVSSEKNQLILEFEDSGEGIPKKNLDKIFEPLFTTKQRGTGLGLASVKSIVDTHGGTISVKSPPTIFTITLPQNPDIHN